MSSTQQFTPAERSPDIAPKSVYFFGDEGAEGTKDMKAILGGKGANLAEMTNLGVPVPPGFTIACDVCIAYLRSDGAKKADVVLSGAKDLHHSDVVLREAKDLLFSRSSLEAEVSKNLKR